MSETEPGVPGEPAPTSESAPAGAHELAPTFVPPPTPPDAPTVADPTPPSGRRFDGWLVAMVATGVLALVAVVFAVVYFVHQNSLHYAAGDVPSPTPIAASAQPVVVNGVVNDPDGGYSIKFPGGPQPIRSSVPVGSATLTSAGYRFTSGTGASQSLYEVQYLSYPLTMDVSNASARLDSAVSGAVKSAKGTVIDGPTTVMVDGEPGREFTVSTTAGYARVLYVLRDHTFYTVEVLQPQRSVPGFAAFAASFKLT